MKRMPNYTGVKLKQVINCFEEDNPVIHEKCREVSVEEGLEIAAELFQILNKRKDGIGLAANQVGIDAAVAVVNVREPIILINPKIVSVGEEVPYYEGCLSFPKKGVYTKRFSEVEITTDQVEDHKLGGSWFFSGRPMKSGKGSWEKNKQEKDDELRLLECVAIQHEIDHLNGVTIHDNAEPLRPMIAEKKPGRNEKCPCGSGKKYKKCCINKPTAEQHPDRDIQNEEYLGRVEKGGWATSGG